ncbi:MAG: PBECR2 nuclease fold domain-containing protein [Deltaproteobacteria bacterium]
MNAADEREVPGGVKDFLNGLLKGQAAQVVGSKVRLFEVLHGGKSIDEVLNRSKDAAYHLRRLGDNLVMPVNTPTETEKKIARAVDGQPTWKTLGYSDLRKIEANRIEVAPSFLRGANSIEEAVLILRGALGIEKGGAITVATPISSVRIEDATLQHVVEKRREQRERFAAMILPTLERPTEVWRVSYDDGSVRDRYIKVFSGSKDDILVMVKINPNGEIFWNMMQRDRKGMNALRIGDLKYESL